MDHDEQAAQLRQRYEQLAEAYRNLRLFPLLSVEDMEKFPVPYGQRALTKLHSDISALDEAGKLIFILYAIALKRLSWTTQPALDCGEFAPAKESDLTQSL